MSWRLQIENLHVGAADRPVLSGVDLRVGHGEMVALLGANGSGKTTLLNAISGHIRPSLGSILLDGRPVGAFTARQWARRAAVVPQVYELPAGFTVGDLVGMGRHPHIGLFGTPSDKDKAAVERAMRALALHRVSHRKVERLSGGERQMVVLAMAFAQEPGLLLLDEPTTHLDLKHEARIMEAVRAACAQGLSALAVVHDVRLARRYCDRVALLHSGRIISEGPPAEVLSASTLAVCFGVDPSFFERTESAGAGVEAGDAGA